MTARHHRRLRIAKLIRKCGALTIPEIARRVGLTENQAARSIYHRKQTATEPHWFRREAREKVSPKDWLVFLTEAGKEAVARQKQGV